MMYGTNFRFPRVQSDVSRNNDGGRLHYRLTGFQLRSDRASTRNLIPIPL